MSWFLTKFRRTKRPGSVPVASFDWFSDLGHGGKLVTSKCVGLQYALVWVLGRNLYRFPEYDGECY